MPTSPRRNAFIFTEILGEFDSTQWADVGIGPYAYNSNFGAVSISLFIQVHNKKKQPPGVANQQLLLLSNLRLPVCR